MEMIRCKSLAAAAIFGFSIAGFTACGSAPSLTQSVAIPQTTQLSPSGVRTVDQCDMRMTATFTNKGEKVALPPCKEYAMTMKVLETRRPEPQTATIEDGVNDYDKLPPPVDPSGSSMFYFSACCPSKNFTTAAATHERSTFSGRESSAWNGKNSYYLAQYVNKKKIGERALGSPTCGNSICKLILPDPWNGLAFYGKNLHWDWVVYYTSNQK
jgi:hypothetical protein